MEDDSRGRKKNSRKKIWRMDRRVMEKFVRREYLFRINQIFVNTGKGGFSRSRIVCRSRRERDGEYERDFLEARIRSVPVIRSKQVSTVHRGKETSTRE